MSRFRDLLKRTADRLDIPQPARSRVLLELAGDLDALYEHYLGLGLEENEASRRVEEKFDVSEEALNQLVRVHHTAFRRWMDHFSEPAQSLWEKLMLVVVLLFVVATTGIPLLSTPFFGNASLFAWPALGAGMVALGILLAKIYQIFIKKDHEPRRLRMGLASLLFMACTSLFVGIFGYFLGLYLAMERISADWERAAVYLMGWMVGSTTTMIVSLLVAIFAAVFWFVLINKVKRVELAEATLLLEGES